MEKIAGRVKEALVASGMTQAELARRVAMSESALSKALGGTRSFAAVELAEIAYALDSPLHYLITGEPDPYEVRAAARHVYDRASRTYAADAEPDRQVLEGIALLYRQADERPTGSAYPAEHDVDSRAVGVGPWPGGRQDWPEDPRYDPELLSQGDRRNVVDRYRYWSIEAIRADLASRAHLLHVAIENVSQDLNIGSIVRSANAFNAAGVHIIGRRRWNKRGAMVTNRYLDVRHHPEAGELLDWAAAEGYEVIGIDNGPGSLQLEEAELPERCLMVFGSEGEGISPELAAGCSRLLRIGQYGSTRSINVAAAAAVAMHAWILQHAGPAPD